MKYIFLVNRFSLKNNTDKMVDTLKKVCKRRKMDFIIEVNHDELSTEDIINKYKNTKHIIFAIGGDGIMNRVLNSITKTKNIFSYIPYGTGNDFNRGAKELLKEGYNTIDLIKINDMYCMNVACFGIDADIANKDEVVHSKLIPKSQRYNAAIVSHFIHFKAKEFKVKVEKETIKKKFATITVCNGRYYGGGYHPNPDGLFDDHLMDAYLIDNISRPKIIKYILSMKKGKHEKYNFVRKITTNKMVIESDIPIKSNIDGEILESKKFNLEIVKNGLNIYYNKELIDEITKEMKNKK